jgi:hypothetical protein
MQIQNLTQFVGAWKDSDNIFCGGTAGLLGDVAILQQFRDAQGAPHRCGPRRLTHLWAVKSRGRNRRIRDSGTSSPLLF